MYALSSLIADCALTEVRSPFMAALNIDLCICHCDNWHSSVFDLKVSRQFVLQQCMIIIWDHGSERDIAHI